MLDGGSPYAAALWLMFGYCAAPGAVNAESLRRGVQGGFTSAFLVQLGAVAGRVLWAGLALAGTEAVDSSSAVHAVLAATGAFLLLRSSWHALAATVSTAPTDHPDYAARHGDFVAACSCR